MRTRIATILVGLSLLVSGCANAVVIAEHTIEAGADEWHAVYSGKLDDCKAAHPPRTPEAEACFGPWYDADEQVGSALAIAVAALRAYWRARSLGQRPSIPATLSALRDALAALPPEAREYFAR